MPRRTFSSEEDEGIRVRLRIEPPEDRRAALGIPLLPLRRNVFSPLSIKTPVVRYIELRQVIRGRSKSNSRFACSSRLRKEAVWIARRRPRTSSRPSKGLEKQVTSPASSTKNVTRTAISEHCVDETVPRPSLHRPRRVPERACPFSFSTNGRGGPSRLTTSSSAGFFPITSSMKLVFLNSCKGAEVSSTEPLLGMASQLVKCGIPAVIAMQYAIGDDQAILFAREFYRALFRGLGQGPRGDGRLACPELSSAATSRATG